MRPMGAKAAMVEMGAAVSAAPLRLTREKAAPGSS